jgi:2-succinyl-6-hydroxy-2,4-cyclohexadiene-1-carboxylate synthase
MVQLQSQYWSGGNLRIHYYSAGNPSCPGILFFHGFIGSGYDWSEVIKYLLQDYYCVAPDLPGHGKTWLDLQGAEFTWKALSEIMVQFIKDLPVDKITGIGYSMGGRLALYLAITHPALFKALIIESASPGLKTLHERKERIRQDESLAREMENTDFAGFLEKWYQQPLFTSLRDHSGFQELLKRRETENPLQLAAALRLMSTGKQPSQWDKLKTIRLPLYFLAGESDPKYSTLMSEMKRLCPGSVLQIIKDAGHNSHFEKPLVFLQYISNFLDQIQEKP